MESTNKNQLPTSGNDRIEFDRKDFEILDLVLDQAPELRICAGVIKAARAAELSYPVKSVTALVKLLPEKEVRVEGRRLQPRHIKRYLPDEFFPVENERELVTRCYVALIRCRDDMAWAARAPAYAKSLLKEFNNTINQKEHE